MRIAITALVFVPVVCGTPFDQTMTAEAFLEQFAEKTCEKFVQCQLGFANEAECLAVLADAVPPEECIDVDLARPCLADLELMTCDGFTSGSTNSCMDVFIC